MSKEAELKEQVEATEQAPTTENATQDAVSQQRTPIFEEIQGMDSTKALDVLIQCALISQKTGRLSVRDSVLLGKAIDVLAPGNL